MKERHLQNPGTQNLRLLKVLSLSLQAPSVTITREKTEDEDQITEQQLMGGYPQRFQLYSQTGPCRLRIRDQPLLGPRNLAWHLELKTHQAE